MAKMVVDRLVEREARDAPCRTAEIPLGQAVAVEDLPVTDGVGESARAALAARYGYAAHEVLSLIAARPQLAESIVPGLPDVMAEVVLAARREQARSVGDVLLRRTRLGLIAARELLDGEHGETSPPGRVAAELARELGWDERRQDIEVAGFLEEARLEGILVEDAQPPA
jgi:glycerol-3-phosphate dehydrogenase